MVCGTIGAMNRSVAFAAAAAVCLLVGACTPGDTADTTEPAATAEPATPTETKAAPTAEATAPAVPARADQDRGTRILAEAYYEQGVRDIAALPGTTGDELVAAGDAMCDAWDRGDSLQSVLIVGAALLPEVETTDDLALIAGTAAGILCPEHAPS